MCVCACVCVFRIDRAREATRNRATHNNACALSTAMWAVVAAVAAVAAACVCVCACVCAIIINVSLIGRARE